MNKEKEYLTIQEVFQCPNNTEFEVTFSDGSKLKHILIKKCEYLEDKKLKELQYLSTYLLNAKYKIIQPIKEVSFQDILFKYDGLCKVEHKNITNCLDDETIKQLNQFLKFDNMMKLLSELSSEQLKEVLKYGKWYIKEGN